MWFVTAAVTAAACSDGVEPADPCDDRPVIAGGAAELGLGMEFAPVADRQEAELVLGTQGLWMFLVNARAHDMELGSEAVEGVVIEATDTRGARISLESGCRTRRFEDQGDGTLQLATAFLLPLLPDVTPTIDGATITIRLEIRDSEGRRATDARTVIARLPNR